MFDGQELNMVRASKEDKILKWLCKYDSNLIMFHHRYPTSTINVKRAAHPFSTKDYFKDQYIMVHNGVISNAKELYKEHQEMGIEYQSLLQDGTFNDSEALLWDLALTLEGKQKELTARGSIAFVCIKLTDGKLNKMHFGRNSSPLNMFRNKDGIALSSEGEGESIDRDKLYTFNYELQRLTNREFEIPSYYSTYTTPTYTPSYTDGNYDTYWNRVGTGVNDYLDSDFDRDGNYQCATYGDDETYEMFKAKERNVQQRTMRYLAQANGNFELAYNLAEHDYEELFKSDEDSVDFWTLESVLDDLASDPEYLDENSVSSLWSLIWEK